MCRTSPLRRPVVSRRANARGANPARRAKRISRLLPRSSVVTTRYFRERISRLYRESPTGAGVPLTCDAVPMTDADLARRVRERCRLTGRFVLRSGRVADKNSDKYQFEADPALLGELAAAMVPLFPLVLWSVTG